MKKTRSKKSRDTVPLKVPKCEIFDLFDFNDFYAIKSLQVGDLRAEIKKLIFFNVGQIRTILSLLAYAQRTLATIFHFELAPKKVVSDSFGVHLKVTKQLFLIFHFFHWLKLDLVKMAKLACDHLCQRTLSIRQQIASAHCAYGSTLLAHTAHMVLAHTAHMVALCQSTLRIRQQNCQRTLRMRQQNRVKLCSLQSYDTHTVALCQRTLRLRQHTFLKKSTVFRKRVSNYGRLTVLQDFYTPRQIPRRGVGLKQINTCVKVFFHVTVKTKRFCIAFYESSSTFPPMEAIPSQRIFQLATHTHTEIHIRAVLGHVLTACHLHHRDRNKQRGGTARQLAGTPAKIHNRAAF